MLVQLKGNQPALLKAMVALSEQTPPSDGHHEDQIGQRNRIESRTTSVWPLATHCVPEQWPGIRCLVRVRRNTEVFDPALKQWQPRGEIAWYVCTRELSARTAAHAVRDHWLIENSLHHVRDVAMGEDACRIRRQPGVFAQLRTWSLNLMRHAGHLNITSARQILAWSSDALLSLLRSPQR